MPSFSYRAVTRKLQKLEFVFLRQAKGSYEFWHHPKTGKIILLAKHTKDFPNGTVLKIAKKLGFQNLQEFEKFK